MLLVLNKRSLLLYVLTNVNSLALVPKKLKKTKQNKTKNQPNTQTPNYLDNGPFSSNTHPPNVHQIQITDRT